MGDQSSSWFGTLRITRPRGGISDAYLIVTHTGHGQFRNFAAQLIDTHFADRKSLL